MAAFPQTLFFSGYLAADYIYIYIFPFLRQICRSLFLQHTSMRQVCDKFSLLWLTSAYSLPQTFSMQQICSRSAADLRHTFHFPIYALKPNSFRKRNESVTLNIDGAVINATKSARDLGVIVDDSLDMKEHIRKVCRAATFGIYRIGKIRKYLNQSSTERLVNALVTSHLDFCNSLRINLPASHLAPLQHTQNTAARLITRTRKHDHITPVIHTLHWLLIPQRIEF